MQATQSSKATDFPEPDSFGPCDTNSFDSSIRNGRIRDLPSPFSAPIQAARKYLERQRSGGLQSERGKAQVADAGETSVGRSAQELASGAQSKRQQASREQDRRLERSLYEGHSIEAGLQFGEPQSFAVKERACFAESDGTEPLFPYASPYMAATPGTAPNAEAVRGAIFRLARDSGAVAVGAVAVAVQEQPIPVSQTGQATNQIVPGATFQPQSEDRQPSGFAEVARQVWGRSGIAENRNSATVSETAPLSLPAEERSVELTRSIPAGGPIPKVQNAARTTKDVSREDADRPDGLSPSAFKDAALAHDACNLLSGLLLYSDLLNSPGVLAEQHRHYAEELKLIAERSQVLIERLLNRGEAPPARSSAVEVGAMAPDAKPDADENARTAPDASDVVGAIDRPGAEEATVCREVSFLRSVGTAIHMAPRPEGVPPVKSTGTPAESKAGAGPVFSAHARAEATAPAAAPLAVEGTSLVDLLMRWGSLLSTLAHGTLDVSFGPQAATPVPVAAEPLERILVNLVRNARAATIAGGSIRIGVGTCAEERTTVAERAEASGTAPELASRSDRSIVLTVDDSGCGMTEAQVNRILGVESEAENPILSADAQTVSDGYGTWPDHGRDCGWETTETDARPTGKVAGRRGLGLQVVRELVQSSGGRFAIQSRPGRGTRIQIRWPVEAGASASTATIVGERTGPAEKPAPEAAPRPMLAVAPRTVDAPRSHAAIGPDGFSETELRAMMLRLHRSSSAPEAAGEEAVRSEAVRSEALQTERTPGRRGAGAGSRFESDNYSAVKGAIAC